MSVAEILAELDRNPSLAAYSAAARKLRSAAGLKPFRVALLANHTLDIGTALGVEAARRGLALELYQAGYDQYRQELLNAGGGLDAFRPDAVLVSLNLESTFPGVSGATCAVTTGLPSAREWAESLRAVLGSYRERSAVPIFVLDFIPPVHDMDGVFGGGGLFGWTMELNGVLRAVAAGLPSVFVIDAAKLACSTTLAEWRDPRMWLLARAGINPKKFPLLAARIARSFAALTRPAAKCLVLDLDNTLWGGVLGDAGADGVLCADTDYPANAYAGFQRAVVALRSRGVLLAVASKNDRESVDDVFGRRREMPLKSGHISDWEVHWGPKPESLQRIAERLNIGLDSLVFLDDNPAEVDLVRMTLPQVRAYVMPKRPEEFAPFLASLEDFDQLWLSAEDLRRAELYEARKKTAEIAATSTDLESFYRSLRTVVTPEPASPANFDRLVQLIHKTNQFNLTTRRHDAAALKERMDRGSELWGFRASDLHGDHGIIAVALLDFADSACVVDTLLMSCRVIGRTIETAILSFLEERAAARGAGEIRGEYRPTPKNGPARDYYERHGYLRTGESDAATVWVKDVSRGRTECPEWIALTGELTEAAGAERK
ncbi:MAG TPA: HAD-IIIC family phosphatase [Bryobacteraceae bacterium]|nr:HAD-IIIC family phosphatase [Bryobacteraceae bacterium]